MTAMAGAQSTGNLADRSAKTSLQHGYTIYRETVDPSTYLHIETTRAYTLVHTQANREEDSQRDTQTAHSVAHIL